MPRETTRLSPQDERRFQAWAAQNRIPDVDTGFYDYRGYWKAGGAPVKFGTEHFPDTFKQHGHPSFSLESQYATGLQDAGQWIGETLVPPPMPSHTGVPPDVRNQLMALMRRGSR